MNFPDFANMELTAKIKGIKYKVCLLNNLEVIDVANFDINDAPAAFLLNDNHNVFAVSKWVSPKRTRSYPYERVYNTLQFGKKITIIPIIKDEGLAGDRDYLQWDTISLMSLLDVYVLLAYYDKAEINPRNKNKITNQQFNNDYIISQINEIKEYHSSALHWNLNELNINLQKIITEVKQSYSNIEQRTGVKLHNIDGIDNFRDKIGNDVSHFMQYSRSKAKQAQAREVVTIQPKESLSSSSKMKITITNYLGGQYFLTVDEVIFDKDTLLLIESKHSKNEILPSIGDVKDGLVKMILFSNLNDVLANGNKIKFEPVLSLTSDKLIGGISLKSTKKEILDFTISNNFFDKQIILLEAIMNEAKHNNFTINIHHSK
jgi:hypothetical protein